MVSIILGLICFVIVLQWDVKSDYDKWTKNIPVDHTKEAWQRALYLLPSFILLFIPLWFNILGAIVVAGWMSTTYLLLFDGLYNQKRGYNWWFTGGVDPDDAWWDKLQRKIPLFLLKVLKIGIPILLTAAYVILL